MTVRRTDGDVPDNDRSKDAAAREARASVQEAIGKLIGDDAARERGTAEKNAAASDASDAKKSPDTNKSPRR